jgi:hypothetical protein
MFRFTIRDLLWLMVVGIELGEPVLIRLACGESFEGAWGSESKRENGIVANHFRSPTNNPK